MTVITVALHNHDAATNAMIYLLNNCITVRTRGRCDFEVDYGRPF